LAIIASGETMRLKLDITKSIHENAAMYYEKAKQIRKKIEGLEKAIADSEKELENALAEEKKKKEAVKIKREKKWYEKFHWFFTSNGRLAIGGKDAKQNDIVFAKYMEDNDLFFHADIQGASAVILKDGINAIDEELQETAQFAASFSNAWKNGNASVDVYAVRKEQLSKHATGGYIPAGGFAIAGERRWFRNTQLGLKIGVGQQGLEILPAIAKRKLENEIFLIPAKTGKEKGELAKGLAKRFGVSVDELLQILPSGRTKTKI
jgi:predicted ribosome quality control (RQC) complex YloA/Tae2 family protein